MKLDTNSLIFKLIYFSCVVFFIIISLCFYKDKQTLFLISGAIFGITWIYSIYSKDLKRGWIFLSTIFIIYFTVLILKKEYEYLLSYTFALVSYTIYYMFSLISLKRYKRVIYPPRGGRLLPGKDNTFLDILFSLVFISIVVIYGFCNGG